MSTVVSLEGNTEGRRAHTRRPFVFQLFSVAGASTSFRAARIRTSERYRLGIGDSPTDDTPHPYTPPLVRSRSPKAKHAREVRTFSDIPNVGPATAADFALLGFASPHALIGQDPYALYHRLCVVTAAHQDPCVADVFIAAVRFMEGAPPHPWWYYTAERKQSFAARVERVGSVEQK